MGPYGPGWEARPVSNAFHPFLAGGPATVRPLWRLGTVSSVPIAFLIRLLARIALLGVAGLIARRTVPPPWRTPGQPVPSGPGPQWPGPIPEGGAAGVLSRAISQRLGTAVDVGRILLHLVAVAVFLAATGILVTAGTTLTALGPRWVGIILLVVAAFTALVLVGEVRTAIRLRNLWRKRREAERLRGATPTQLPPPG